MGDVISEFGCNGCPASFGIISVTRQEVKGIINEAVEAHLPYSLSQDNWSSGSPGHSCGNELVPIELRKSRNCGFNSELGMLATSAEKAGLMVIRA